MPCVYLPADKEQNLEATLKYSWLGESWKREGRNGTEGKWLLLLLIECSSLKSRRKDWITLKYYYFSNISNFLVRNATILRVSNVTVYQPFITIYRQYSNSASSVIKFPWVLGLHYFCLKLTLLDTEHFFTYSEMSHHAINTQFNIQKQLYSKIRGA